MKNFKKMLLSLPVVLALVGFMLTVGGVRSAVAAGSSPSSLAAGVEVAQRRNPEVSGGVPLANSSRGAKVFGADTVATKVLDEKGVAPVAGVLASIEIGQNEGTNVPRCYLMVFDSSVAADTTEANSVSRMLVPPLIGVTSAVAAREFLYPRQFQKGLVVLVGGPGAASCSAKIAWLPNGGSK